MCIRKMTSELNLYFIHDGVILNDQMQTLEQ